MKPKINAVSKKMAAKAATLNGRTIHERQETRERTKEAKLEELEKKKILEEEAQNTFRPQVCVGRKHGGGMGWSGCLF